MKDSNQAMEILEAFDLYGSYNQAARAVGCAPNTVKSLVLKRTEGALGTRGQQRQMSQQQCDGYAGIIAELIEESNAHIRADVVHRRLVAMGFSKTMRTTRRYVAHAKETWTKAHTRIFWPWIPEPSKWAQYDFSDGPVIGGRKTTLFHYYLPYSKFKVTLQIPDQSLPNVLSALDTCFRVTGGVPSFILTDNAKTATQRHIAGVALINAQMARFGSHYGFSLRTCVPYDPASKGGVERSVRLAKEHLCPKESNLISEYDTHDNLDAAIRSFDAHINQQVHTASGKIPALELGVERAGFHPLPKAPFTQAFGVMRKVDPKMPIVRYLNVGYSVAPEYRGCCVYVRRVGDEIIIVGERDYRLTEIARHSVGVAHSFMISQEHKAKDHPSGPLLRRPIPTTETQAGFLGLCEEATLWLERACATGVSGIEASMAILLDETEKDTAVAVIKACIAKNSFSERTTTALAKSMTKQMAANRVPATPSEVLSEVQSYGASTDQWSALEAVS